MMLLLERLANDAVHLNGRAAFCVCAGAERSSVPLVDKEGDGCRCRMQRGTNITGSLLRMCQTRMTICFSTLCKPLNRDITLRWWDFCSIADQGQKVTMTQCTSTIHRITLGDFYWTQTANLLHSLRVSCKSKYIFLGLFKSNLTNRSAPLHYAPMRSSLVRKCEVPGGVVGRLRVHSIQNRVKVG